MGKISLIETLLGSHSAGGQSKLDAFKAQHIRRPTNTGTGWKGVFSGDFRRASELIAGLGLKAAEANSEFHRWGNREVNLFLYNQNPPVVELVDREA